MSTRDDWHKWVHTRQEVEARTATGDLLHARGRVISLADHPTLTIETEDGERVHWAAHLTHAVEPVDDPSKDLAGTVRRGPDGRSWVKIGGREDDTLGWDWITPVDDSADASADVAKFPVIGAVPGTPAAEAQTEAELPRWERELLEATTPRVFRSDGPEPHNVSTLQLVCPDACPVVHDWAVVSRDENGGWWWEFEPGVRSPVPVQWPMRLTVPHDLREVLS